MGAAALSRLPDFGGLTVLVVGDVMLDRYWFGDVSRISPEAPVPVVAVEHIEDRVGGAANVAANVAALGAHAVLLSVVGADDAGDRLDSLAVERRVEPVLHRDAGTSTTIKLRVVARNQQLIRLDFETRPDSEVLAECVADYRERLEGSDVVVLSDYGKGGLAHVRALIELARESAVPVLIDPKGDDYDRYRGASLITPNLREFSSVAGGWGDDEDKHARAHALAARLELEGLLVTESEHGMTLYRCDGTHVVSPARAREVYDVSGAGDTVIAAVAVARAAGLSDAHALEIANAAAGVVVGRLGTVSAAREEIESVLGP